MYLIFSLKRQASILLLLSCMAITSCTNPISEPATTLTDNKIYLQPSVSSQYPPGEVMRITGHTSDQTRNQHDKLHKDNYLQQTFQQFILKNGLRVDFLIRNDSPIINIMVIVKAGRDHTNSQDELVSPLVLKLLRQGTQQYSKADFQQAVSLLGEPIQYWQTSRYSVGSINILPQDLEQALHLFAQQLAYSAADNPAYEKIIAQQLLENKLKHSSGSYLAKRLFYRNNYAHAHPYYAHKAKKSDIKNLSKNDILTFYQTHYKPANTRLIISGNVDAGLLINKVSSNFSGWQSELPVQTDAEAYTAGTNKSLLAKHKRSKFDFIERKGAQQIDLLYGMVTLPRHSADWLSLHVIAALLGGGPSSRLFSDLREKQGLTYFISAQQMSGSYPSPFFIETSIAPDKLLQAVNGINNHIQYLCRNNIDNQELENIKQQLSNELIFKLQTNQQLVNNKLYQFENGLNEDYLYQLAKDIRQINAHQLRGAANKYLCGQHNIIAVGELNTVDKAIKEKLDNYVFKTHYLPLH